ncbi:MAG TPA: hypothetical protein VG123_32520 [Streptosporangiaceae bacterium]|nr:hypothetical protein [Streptosporangiaceae bacterium]
MAEVQLLLEGLSSGESLRWHQDRLWLADWGAREVAAVDPEGRADGRRVKDRPAADRPGALGGGRLALSQAARPPSGPGRRQYP